MVKDKSGEGGQTAVGLDPINEGVQPDVLQRGLAGMARQRSKSQDVRTDTWNVTSMVSRSGEVVDALHRRKIYFCCAQETRWKGESARMLGVTAYEHSTNRPIGNSRKLVLLRGLMVDCDQRTSTVLKNNYYFLIHWYKGETLIIGMFHCIFM